MAVLYRTNQNPAQLLRLLDFQGIPTQVKGTKAAVYQHWICQDFCAYLAAAAGSTKRADWLRIIRRPERYISRGALGTEPVSLDRLFEYYAEDKRRLDQLDRLSYDLALLKKVPPYAAISHLRRYMGYDGYLEEQDQNGEGRLFELAEQIQETADGCQNAEEWLRYVRRKQEAVKTEGMDGSKDRPAGVRFMTMHGSKGLEFPVVFLADANEGITPHRQADSPEGIEEERRRQESAFCGAAGPSSYSSSSSATYSSYSFSSSSNIWSKASTTRSSRASSSMYPRIGSPFSSSSYWYR